MFSRQTCHAKIHDESVCLRLSYNGTNFCRYHQNKISQVCKEVKENEIWSLEDLIDMTYHKEWSYKCLSANPNISMKYIRQNTNLDWDYKMISANQNINIKFVLDNIDKKWNWIKLSETIHIDDIANNPELDWNYITMSCNLSLNIKFILNNIDKNWSWDELSKNENIKIYQILKYPNLYWNYKCIKLRSDFNLLDNELFIKFENYRPIYKYEKLEHVCEKLELRQTVAANELYNSNFFDMDVLNILSSKYNIRFLCVRLMDFVKISDIIENPDIPWDYKKLSMINTITPEIVKNNLDIPWNKFELVGNDNFRKCDLDFLEIDITYNYWNNQNISYNQIIKDNDDMDYYNLSNNEFHYKKRLKVINKIKKQYRIRKLNLFYERVKKYLIADLINIVKLYYFG
jgi:hypothetical protein